MKQWLCRFLLLGLVTAFLLPACDDDDGGNPLDPVDAPPDISQFVGAWMIHRSGSVQYLGCTTDCQQQLDNLLDAYFDIPGDTACVRIDTLTDLVLLEPFISNGEINGAVVDGIPLIDCEHAGEVGGDSLITTLSIELLLQTQIEGVFQGFFADYRVSVDVPGGGGCGGCYALLGITGARRLSGDCEP